MADRVFDDRLGLWIVNPANLPSRLPRIKAFGGGAIRDLFLPRSASRADVNLVRNAGLYCHLWVSVDGLAADAYADRTLDDIRRLGPGAVELNIEGPDDNSLAPFVAETVSRIRLIRPAYRLRVNVAPWKSFALPIEALKHDPALYACQQNYYGNMDELLSPADILANMLLYGAPLAKVSVCYAAACRVLGSAGRIRTLPDLTRRHRGVIFHDDLMADAGLL